jgi:hypothetical protein
VPEQHTYDYAIIRVVPRVERGEFVNVGVIVWCAPLRYLKAKLLVDEKKVRALDPKTDIDAIQAGVAAILATCKGGPEAGDLGKLSLSERCNWLIAPRSTILQTSPVHIGRASDLDKALEKIFDEMVR